MQTGKTSGFQQMFCAFRRAIVMAACLAAVALPSVLAAMPPQPLRSVQVELPNQESNAIRQSWPGIGCWFWTKEEFAPDGYKRFIDLHSRHSAFRLLTTSIRYPVEVAESKVHDQIRLAAIYARQHDMAIVMDLDVRLARKAFADKYPSELQEVLRLREVALKEKGEVPLTIESIGFGDHYTFAARGYQPVSGRLVRVYSYIMSPQGIAADSVREITDRCRLLEASAAGVKVRIPCGEQDKGRTACVLAAFGIFTPDVFAPHLLEFQKDVLKRYADVPLAGACKDEWGFPGRGRFEINDPWFSSLMADAYARRRPGRDLARDLLLMARGEVGREPERAAAINHYMEMIWQRNGQIESDFYAGVKEVFGPSAMVATHPTWWYRLAVNEIQKNGISWWLARRDVAQTDETCQFCVRTALAKKWRSLLWFNMYYAATIEPYYREIWQDVLAGGRVNFHPFWPCQGWQEGKLTTSLLDGELLRADARIRLLNYISTAPKDCPVAVIFGHACSVNWAGPAFADFGIKIAETLWGRGFPADLIPSDEIQNGSLVLDTEGWLRYGPQPYAAVVLYQPEFERRSTAEFFRKAAHGKTRLFRVGRWTTDFDGQPLDGDASLPAEMTGYDLEPLIRHLQAAAIEPQTPPSRKGHCRLLDGTHIVISAEKDVTGDLIQETLDLRGRQAQFDALGVAAARFGSDGRLAAMAAGGLKSFRAADLTIELAERADVAIWHDGNGQWHGVLQGFDGPVPDSLTRITALWTRLSVPERYKPVSHGGIIRSSN